MADVKSRQEYAKYRSEATATWKQVYLETHHEDEQSMKAALARMERRGSGSLLPEVESGIAELCIDHAVPWEKVQDRAYARNVSQGTLDQLYDVVRESALEQARQGGYGNLSTGMRLYMTDEQVNDLYDKDMGG